MDPAALDQPPAAQACLETLRAVSGERDGAMERHCVRVFVIAERLAGPQPIDREVLLCATWLHDAGLWCPGDDPYVTEAARLAQRTLAPFDWPLARVQRCMDACEQHHAPTSRADLGLEVELMRRADLVDVSGGLVAHGLPRPWLRGLFRAAPRTGMATMLARAIAGELRHRPQSLWGAFVAPHRTRASDVVAAAAAEPGG